ncbi:ROK family protein [Actinoplanes regularis]|uniref:Glucokinase n=1 Tax=Actinoplanes regularis TaxID=52697 RepID=A0A239A6A3_9ACTN|nr:ROK family protein [Actinoplanes regularis]GIE87094.1 glucokinase [Actinoplanes regularis]SNR90628.1 glucokinase [Actinoplanes regularis]
MSATTVGVDVGGTKTLAVRLDAGGRVLARVRRPTRASTGEELLAGLADIIGAVADGTVTAIGVGLPGLVHTATGTLTYAPTFPFGPAEVGASLRTAFGLPVCCDNDANAAAWAEHRLGAGGGDTTALVTVGTGLGCGMVAQDRLLRGAHGYAAEVSHLIVEPGGEPCGCGERGCFGIEATGWAITQRARRAGEPLDFWGVSTQEQLTGEVVTRAARAGNPVAAGILARTGMLLGRGLAAVANLLDPGVLVVGGGAGEAGELLLEPARAEFRKRLYAAAHRPEVQIRPARLGGDAGAIGAALLAGTALNEAAAALTEAPATLNEAPAGLNQAPAALTEAPAALAEAADAG